MRPNILWSVLGVCGIAALASCGIAETEESQEQPVPEVSEEEEPADTEPEEDSESAEELVEEEEDEPLPVHEADSAVAAMHAGGGRIPLTFRVEDGRHIWVTTSSLRNESAALDVVVLDADSLEVLALEEGARSRDDLAADSYAVEYSITRAIRAAVGEIGADEAIVRVRPDSQEETPRWFVEFDSGHVVTMDGTGSEPSDIQVIEP